MNNPLHSSEASALLDQLEKLGIDVSEHHRKQSLRQHNVLPNTELSSLKPLDDFTYACNFKQYELGLNNSNTSKIA